MSKFIYYPSFSSGNSKNWLLKDRKYLNGNPTRFYSPDYPEEFRYKNFLVSGGHNHRVYDFREKLGLQDSMVMGDSGGFQICTGAIKWKDELRETIFKWLENNCDVGMNLDIPPSFKFEDRFDEALEQSIKNFHYFEDRQTGKVDYLNILQMQYDDNKTMKWYNGVKDFKFQGWSVGTKTSGTIRQLLYSLALLLDNGHLADESCKYLHYLGLSSLFQFIVLLIVQDEMNKKFDGRITISTDSSSPNLSTIFGTYLYGSNWRTYGYGGLTIAKAESDQYHATPLPCDINCPACKGHTYLDLQKWDEQAYMIMTNHNLHIYVKSIDFFTKVINSHESIVKDFLNPQFNQIRVVVQELIQSNSPMQVYQKYIPFLNKFDSANKVQHAKETKVNEFFKYDTDKE